MAFNEYDTSTNDPVKKVDGVLRYVSKIRRAVHNRELRQDELEATLETLEAALWETRNEVDVIYHYKQAEWQYKDDLHRVKEKLMDITNFLSAAGA